MERRIGPVTLKYVMDKDLEILVTYDTGQDDPWVGVASFPWEMEDEALSWMDRIEMPTDVEDLLRQWAPVETWRSFQKLRNAIGI